jgi:hypothetical protein
VVILLDEARLREPDLWFRYFATRALQVIVDTFDPPRGQWSSKAGPKDLEKIKVEVAQIEPAKGDLEYGAETLKGLELWARVGSSESDEVIEQ